MISQPAAQQDACEGPEQEIVEVSGRWPAAGRVESRLPRQPDRIAPPQHQPGQIGKAVPANCDRPDLDRDRVKTVDKWLGHESFIG